MANRKVPTIGLILGTALLLPTSPAFAQSAGSGGGSFANAFLIPTIVCNAGAFDIPGNSPTCSKNGGGPKVLYGNIKTPSAANKNVLVMATLESSILTNTLVASKNGANSTSSASGAVVVKPHVMYCPNNDCSGASGDLVDITTIGGTVTPSVVTFNQRTQTLSATLQGLNCTIDSATGLLTCTDPETIGLLLSTMSANGFNFLAQTPGQGVYQVQLEIGLTATASTNSIQAGATATVAVGAGSLVQMIVQAQTPFDTVKLCKGTADVPGPPNSCGP
jgi:hypothetical protein